MIAFSPRAKCHPIPTGHERRWLSTDGHWAIIEIRSHDRPRKRRYLLARQMIAGEYIAARCRSRETAEKKAAELQAQAASRGRASRSTQPASENT